MPLGHHYGLRPTFFVTKIWLFQGARVAIHDQQIKPFLNTQSIAAPVGETTFLDVRAQKLERLGGNYGECLNTWPESLNLNTVYSTFYKYSLEACIKFCILTELAKKCQCLDSYELRFSADPKINNILRSCSHTNTKDRICRNNVYKSYQKEEFQCPCEIPCNATEYFYLSSRSPWPSEAYSSYLASQLTKVRSQRVHTFFKNLLRSSTPVNVHDSIRKNFVRLEVSFNPVSFRRITEKPSYTIADLVSDFGGNISLWLGWSIFALFEVIIFFTRCSEALYRRLILKL